MRRIGRLRGGHLLSRALLAAALVALPMALAACWGGGGASAGSAGPQVGMADATATASPTTETASATTPTATLTTSATATPMTASVSEQEAESVVQSWFHALASQDYQQAESLTTGNAHQQTQALINTIHQQEQQNNVTVQFEFHKLDTNPASGVSEPQGGQAVLADFAGEAYAQKGPLRIPARSVSGQATFVVEPTSSGPKISNIENLTGLSGQ